MKPYFHIMRFLNVQVSENVLKVIYARSQLFISSETSLYALTSVYKRGNEFMRARNTL